MFGGGPICWSSKNATIALSSAKAEYRGAVNACIQVVWLQGILSEFEICITLSIVIFFDNQSTINISIYPDTRKRTKHIEIHMHYIRELVHDRTIVLKYYPTDEQIVDIFTKRFFREKFHLPLFTIGGEFIRVIRCFL